MSQSASQAHAFYREVAKNRVVWTIRDAGGYPAPMTRTGQRAQPFWSSKSRIDRIKKIAPDYAAFEAEEIPWEEFRDKWLPELQRDGYLVGVNWSGADVTGYDLDAPWVRDCIESYIDRSAG